MTLKEQVLAGLDKHLNGGATQCHACLYNRDDEGNITGYITCRRKLYEDVCTLINEMQDVIDLLGAKE